MKIMQTPRRLVPAFTLIELLVVISIIGILAGLLLANFAGIRDRADDAKNKNNLKQLQTALRMKYNDTQAYPASGDCAAAIFGYMNAKDVPASCTFTPGATTDTFTACITLSNAADSEARDSQSRCGVADDDLVDGKFCICSN